MQMLKKFSLVSPAIDPFPTLVVEDLLALSTLEAAVLRIAEAYDFGHHPYFEWMRSPSTTGDAFCQSQLPFRFAVESFSQALAAVLARMPMLEARLPLAENIAEEHGRGDYWRSHKYTFRQYLQALGASAEALQSPCTITVLAFNQAILTYGLTQSGEAGAAMLGMIEYLYVGISGAIAHTILQRGWVAPHSQSHYAVHEHLDVEHAQELLTLAAPVWNEPRARLQVAQGLLLGAYYFWNLYRDLKLAISGA